MYNSFQNNGNNPGFQQSYNTGNQQQMPQQQFQLRNANTTTEFGDFVSNSNQQNGLQPQGTGYINNNVQSQYTGFQQPGIQPNGTGFQQQSMQPNSTGFQQQGIQPNSTGFQQQGNQPMNTSFNQSLQPQGTGYSQLPSTSFNSFQQNFNQQLNPQTTGSMSMPQTSFSNNQPQPLLPQQTGFYSGGNSQPQQGFLKPNATGFVNSMSQTPNFNNQLVLPNLRLSFVTPEDQKKFEKLFRSKVPVNSNTISGANCREILMRSGLPPKQLAQIWNLADTLKAGELMFPEFVLAMYLINSVLQGESLPFALEKRIRDEVTKFVDAINFQVGEQSETSFNAPPPANPTPFDDLTAGMHLQPQPTGMMPSISFGGQQPGQLMPQNTGNLPPTSFGQQFNGFQQQQPLQNQYTGSQAPMTSFGNFNGPNTAMLRANQTGMGLVSQPTGVLPQTNFQINAPLTAQKTGFGNNDLYSQNNFSSKFTAENEDYVTSEEKALFYKIFDTYDTQSKGILDSKTSVEIFRKSGLSRQDLEHIWTLADADNTGKLNKQEFTVGMHLVYRKLNGHALPKFLPRSLVPQSNQMLDMMKEELKKQSSDSKDQGSNKSNKKSSTFVNDDSLPSFRDRRNTKVDLELELQKQSKSEENEKEEEVLRNLIRDKKILIEAETYKNEERLKEKQLKDLESLKQIEILKKSIISLPKSTAAGENNMRSSYESLNAKLISILTSIDTVEDAIISAKVQKYKKENPSSIVGTGPNGEVTEQDLRKAKKKAALNERMALLTGKQITPSVSIEDEENKLKSAVESIKDESKNAKETVELIKNDITEILNGIKSAFYGSDANTSETKKFELGLGLEPELKDFIKRINTASTSGASSPTNTQRKLNVQPTSSPLSSARSSQENLASDRPQASRTPSYQTPEEKSAYIKEQAQKRMNEKLAKMGLGRRSRRNRSNIGSPTVSTDNLSEPKREPVVEAVPSVSPVPVQQPAANSSDDEDEEEKALRIKLESLRLKKQQKEERMRLLKQQIADAEKEEPAAEKPQAVVENTYVSPPNPVDAKAEESDDWDAEPTSTVPVQPVGGQPQKFNPFRKTDVPDATSKPQFFKQPVVGSGSQISLNEKTAEEQRKSQRGLDNDSDGWSDEEVATVPIQNTKPEFYTPPVSTPPVQQSNIESSVPKPVFENASLPPLINNNAPVKVMSKYNDDSDGWSDEEGQSVPQAPPVPTAAIPKPPSFIPEVPQAPALNFSAPPSVQVEDKHVSDDELSLPESVSSDDEWN